MPLIILALGWLIITSGLLWFAIKLSKVLNITYLERQVMYKKIDEDFAKTGKNHFRDMKKIPPMEHAFQHFFDK